MMRFSHALLWLCALARAQQSGGTIPACSVTCDKNAVASSGCSITDFTCQCGPATQTPAITDALVACLTRSCSAADIAIYEEVAISVCATVAAGGSVYTSTYAPAAGTGAPTGTVGAQSSSAATGGKKNNTGLIVGATIGGVAAIALVVIAILLLLRQRKRRVSEPAQQRQTPYIPAPIFVQNPNIGTAAETKSQLHSESITVVSPMTLASKDTYGFGESKQMEVETVSVTRTETGEMQRELRPMVETQEEEQPAVELYGY